MIWSNMNGNHTIYNIQILFHPDQLTIDDTVNKPILALFSNKSMTDKKALYDKSHNLINIGRVGHINIPTGQVCHNMSLSWVHTWRQMDAGEWESLAQWVITVYGCTPSPCGKGLVGHLHLVYSRKKQNWLQLFNNR